MLKGLSTPAEVKAKLAGLATEPDITIAGSPKAIRDFITQVKRTKTKTVYVAGGDGTIAAVVKGLIDHDVTFGLIPTGSANNIATSLGLSDDIEAAVEVVNKAKTTKMDLGRVNNQIFIESVGIGLLAKIMDRVGEQDSKKEVLRVIGHTVAEVMTSEVIPVRLINDGTEHILATVWLTVTNTGRAAMSVVDPNAKVADGQFETVYAEQIPGHKVAEYVTAFVRNEHLGKPGFHRLRGRHIELTLPPGIQTHVDGELKRWRKVDIQVLPAAVKVYVP